MGQKVLGIIVAIIAGVVGYSVTSKMFRSGSSTVTDLRSAPEPAAVPGWKRHTSPSAGFSIHLPVEFTAFDPKSPELQKALEISMAENPQAAELMRKAQAQAEFAFWAFDTKNMSANFAKNVNANITPKRNKPGTQADLDREKTEMLRQLPTGSKVLRLEFVDLPAGRAILSEMDLALPGSQVTHSFGYIFSTKDNDVTVTFTCLPQDAPAFGLIADKAMRTVRPLN